jgi:CO/xanthine dehydrogenase Mo-binding subunit
MGVDREEEFIGATTRHQMTTKVRLGARRDGTLTAIDIRVVSNTGAYGNHGSETLAAAISSPMALYRSANKKAVGYAVYTNMVPGGGFRGYGSSQTTFALECAIDELARLLKMDPLALRRKNIVRQGDMVDSVWQDASDASFGSYGLDQCMDFVEARLKRGNGVAKPEGEEWAEGTGVALAMLECGPPTEHRSGAEMRLRATARTTWRSALRRWATASPPPTSRSPPPSWAAASARSTSSMPIPTRRPTTPAPSPVPAPSWRARRSI